MDDCLIIEHQSNGVARLTLNRPDEGNSLDENLVSALRDSLRQLSKESKLRVLILTGAGEHFCQSVDPGWVHKYQNSHVDTDMDPGSKISTVLSELDNFPTPVIARINGDALGVGVGLAACCDIIVCQNNSRFAVNEVRAGLAPIASAPYIMSTIGMHQTRRWLLTGESSSADKALELGFAHISVEPDKLDAAVEDQVSLILQGAPNAQREIKQWIKELSVHGHHESASFLRSAGVMFRRCLNSTEAKEGINAWIGNKQPPWQ